MFEIFIWIFTDIDAQCTKYEELLKSSAGKGSSLREMEQRCQRLDKTVKEAEQQATTAQEQVREHKQAITRSEKAKAQAERDMQDTNRELIQVEKMLSGIWCFKMQ